MQTEGYVIGTDKDFMYAILIADSKAYQFNCTLDRFEDVSEVKAERKFIFEITDENEDPIIKFTDEYINKDVDIEYLKNNIK